MAAHFGQQAMEAALAIGATTEEAIAVGQASSSPSQDGEKTAILD